MCFSEETGLRDGLKYIFEGLAWSYFAEYLRIILTGKFNLFGPMGLLSDT